MSDRALARLVEHIEHLVRRTTMIAAARALAPVVRAEISAAFREQRSPDGPRWRAAEAQSPHPLLVASGRLRGAFVVTPTDTGVRVQNRTMYAAVHQRGARIRRRQRKQGQPRRKLGGGAQIPARPMLPAARWGPRPTERLKAAAFHAVRVLLGINRR